MLTKLITLFSAVLYVSTAKVNYRFPQFSKEGLSEEDLLSLDRLVEINKFAEDFRGWDDEVPHYPDELKVINITSENYKS